MFIAAQRTCTALLWECYVATASPSPPRIDLTLLRKFEIEFKEEYVFEFYD